MIYWVRRNLDNPIMLFGFIVFLLSILWSCESHARTAITFHILPPGHDGQVQDVGRARYYLLEEYLTLHLFDKELMNLRLETLDKSKVIKLLGEQLVEKDKNIFSLNEDIEMLNGRVFRLDGDLVECEEEVISLSGGVIWPYFVGAAGAVLGIVGTVAWLSSKNNS